MISETKIVNYKHPAIQKLIVVIISGLNSKEEIINACYLYVRDHIKFGYNKSDDISASEVLKDGYGQCNTKSTLFLALLRAANIEARFHGFTIDKRLQYGAVTGVFYWLAPREIIHSWIEVKYEGNWYNLEGLILDKTYLSSLQTYFSKDTESLCGYGVASRSFQNPSIDWKGGNSTYIQKDGIVRDLGLFSNPDEFYMKYGTNPKGIRKIIFVLFVRHLMNFKISKIRRKKVVDTLRTLCSVDDIDSFTV